MVDFIRRHKVAFIALLVIGILSVEGYIRKVNRSHHKKEQTVERQSIISRCNELGLPREYRIR